MVELNWLCASCMHSIPSFPLFMFWITGTRLAPLDVKETYCILRKCRTYMLLWSKQPSKRYVQCKFPAKRVRREAMEWSNTDSWPLVWVWAVYGGLKLWNVLSTTNCLPIFHKMTSLILISQASGLVSVSSRIFFSSGGRLSGELWRRKQMTLDCRFYFYAQHNPPFIEWLAWKMAF